MRRPHALFKRHIVVRRKFTCGAEAGVRRAGGGRAAARFARCAAAAVASARPVFFASCSMSALGWYICASTINPISIPWLGITSTDSAFSCTSDAVYPLAWHRHCSPAFILQSQNHLPAGRDWLLHQDSSNVYAFNACRHMSQCLPEVRR
jgi:hypothetical protein